MQQRPPRKRYADLLLGRSVDDFVTEHRVNGASHRKIAALLRDATDGEIDVSDVTIGAWLRQAEASGEQVPA